MFSFYICDLWPRGSESLAYPYVTCSHSNNLFICLWSLLSPPRERNTNKHTLQHPSMRLPPHPSDTVPSTLQLQARVNNPLPTTPHTNDVLMNIHQSRRWRPERRLILWTAGIGHFISRSNTVYLGLAVVVFSLPVLCLSVTLVMNLHSKRVLLHYLCGCTSLLSIRVDLFTCLKRLHRA